MSANIEKTIARQKQKIAEGQYYEAHQQLRVIAARHLKSHKTDAALDLLSSGAQLLFSAGQGSSGGDLSMYMLEILKDQKVVVAAESRGRVIGLLRAWPLGKEEDVKGWKRFVNESIGWSARHSPYSTGDPDLHHVAGQILLTIGDFPAAEPHLLLGTRSSTPLLTQALYTYYKSPPYEAYTAPLYIARAVFPYLLLGNIRAANLALALFSSKLSEENPGLGVQTVSRAGATVPVFPSLPLFNFLSLLCAACVRGTPELYRLLIGKYQNAIADAAGDGWSEPLEGIAEVYFQIKKVQARNPLMDLMGSMFGGGGGPFGGMGAGGGGAEARRGIGDTPAPAPRVD